MQTTIFEDWGTIEYGTAWERQESYLQQALHIKKDWNDTPAEARQQPVPATTQRLFFCTHPSVYTLGKSGHQENLLINDQRLKELDVTFYKTNRGGDITYHGPGQIVGYPIFDLEKIFTDLGKYMRGLEEVIIGVMAHYGLKGERLPGSTGVWLDVDDPTRVRKICAMGVRCSRWVTMHGFALNVNTNLNYFGYIVPCGIVDKGVTSLAKELGSAIDEEEVKELLKEQFATVFQLDIQSLKPYAGAGFTPEPTLLNA